MNRQLVRWLGLAMVAVLGVGVQWFATRWGAGISPDSTRYVAAARSLAAGTGLQALGPAGDLAPLELWAPLYPAVLALSSSLGANLFDWARVLNAILLAANLLLAGWMIARHRPTSRVAPWVGAVALFISTDFIEVHSWIWTEPLAMTTGFAGLLLLDGAAGARRDSAVLLPALLVGVSCLIRFASLPFVAAGILGLLLLTPSLSPWRRSVRSSAFAVVSMMPLVAWSFYTLQRTGQIAGRAIQFRETGLAELQGGFQIVADWILPGRIQGDVRLWIGEAALLGWAVIALGLMTSRVLRGGGTARGSTSRILEYLTLFVLAYAVMIIGTRLWLSPGVSISERIFTPGYVAMVIVTVGYGADLLSGLRSETAPPGRVGFFVRRGPLLAVVSLLIVWGSFHAIHTAKWAQHSWIEGLGYASPSWRDSPLVRYLDTLPEAAPIYSNGPDAIYILTERPARSLPAGPGEGWSAGDPIPEPILRMRENLESGDGVIVYFRGLTWRPTVTEVQLKRLFVLEPIFGTDLGSIYGLAP